MPTSPPQGGASPGIFWEVFAYVQMEPKFGVAPLWFAWARSGTQLVLFEVGFSFD